MRFIFIVIFIGVALVIFAFLTVLFFPELKQIPVQWSEVKSRFKEAYFRAQIGEFIKSGPQIPPAEPSLPASSFSPVTSPVPQVSSETPSISPISPPSQSKPSISINTYILSGPKEAEIIEETNRVTFKFKAKVSPKETEGQIIFETKVEGFDNDWQEIYYPERTINFPSGPKEYTFLVRAKIRIWTQGKSQDFVDPTPAKRTFKINTSPYFGKVKIYSIQTPSSWSPYSLITLGVYLEKKETINITGWQIKGSKGSFTIPQGIEKYDPSYVLLAGSQIPTSDIFVKGNDLLYLSSAANPLGENINFRPNKCFGYLTNYYNFPISIYKNCPKPTIYEEQFVEELSRLEPACQRYILNLGYCEIPKHWEIPGVATDSECISYLNENFNYQGCFKKYSQDEDFLENKWHIYMNRNFNIGALDIIYLRDRNGLLVDKYTYRGLW